MRLARAWAGFFCVVALVPMFGLVDLGTLPGWADPAYVWAVPLEASWGALFTFIVGFALGWIALRPAAARVALEQLALASAALLLCALLWKDTGPGWVGSGLAVVAAVAGWLLRGALEDRPPAGISRGRLAWALAGVALWIPLAVGSLAAARGEPAAEEVLTNGVDHWPVHAATALVLAVLPFLLTWRRDADPLVRWGVCWSACWIGMALLAFPDRLGAVLPPQAGIAMVLWGLLGALFRR